MNSERPRDLTPDQATEILRKEGASFRRKAALDWALLSFKTKRLEMLKEYSKLNPHDRSTKEEITSLNKIRGNAFESVVGSMLKEMELGDETKSLALLLCYRDELKQRLREQKEVWAAMKQGVGEGEVGPEDYDSLGDEIVREQMKLERVEPIIDDLILSSRKFNHLYLWEDAKKFLEGIRGKQIPGGMDLEDEAVENFLQKRATANDLEVFRDYFIFLKVGFGGGINRALTNSFMGVETREQMEDLVKGVQEYIKLDQIHAILQQEVCDKE